MKYANGRLVHRKGGRFVRPPSLEQMGFAVNKGGELTCRKCGGKSIPVLLTGTCCHCGQERAFVEQPSDQL